MSKVWFLKLLFWAAFGGPAMAGWYIDGARVSQDELDPVYSANQYAVNMDQGVTTLDMVDFAGVSVNGTPVVVVGGNVSLLANDAGYLAVESDPVFSAAQAGLATLAGEQSFTGAKTFEADLKLGVGSYLLAMGPTEAEGRFLRTGTRAFRFDGYAGSGNKWDFRDVVTLAGRDPANATATGVYLGDTVHSRGAYQFVYNAGGSGEKWASVLGRSVGTDNNGYRCGVVGMGDHKGKCIGVYGGTAGLRSSDVAYGVVGGDGDFFSTPSGGLLAKARVGVYGYALTTGNQTTNVGLMAEAAGETVNLGLLVRAGDVVVSDGVATLRKADAAGASAVVLTPTNSGWRTGTPGSSAYLPNGGMPMLATLPTVYDGDELPHVATGRTVRVAVSFTVDAGMAALGGLVTVSLVFGGNTLSLVDGQYLPGAHVVVRDVSTVGLVGLGFLRAGWVSLGDAANPAVTDVNFRYLDCLDVGGQVVSAWPVVAPRWALVSVAADYVAEYGECVLVDASGGAVDVGLPDAGAAGRIGQGLRISKRDGGASAVTLQPVAPDKIDGADTVALEAQFESLEVVSDGVNWVRVR